MKAAVYDETGPPEVLRYEDVDDPTCFSGGILVDVEAISIEGGDTLNRAGGPMFGSPHIVGYQCAGTVRESGDPAFVPGDRVVAVQMYGSHAERVAVPAQAAWKLPAGMDVTHAAVIPVPFGTADECLFEFGRLRDGETVLIQAGGSGVGIAAVQMAKRAGATVLATASSDEKLERLKDFGLDHGINYATTDFVAEARRLTAGRGVDLVVDSVGGRTLQGSLQAVGPRGRVITVGNAGREPGFPFDLSPLMANNASLTGVFLGADIATPRVRDMIASHIADVASGALKVAIARSYPLSDAAAAHAYCESRAAFGRVLLIP